jgi:hypothetical protein
MNNWIDIKIRQPEINQICFFAINDSEYFPDVFNYSCGQWKKTFIIDYPSNCGCNGTHVDSVTHWMPIIPPRDENGSH